MIKKCDLNEFFLGNENDSLMEIMYKMNASAKGIVFILDDRGCFQGVITDGDIKRAL